MEASLGEDREKRRTSAADWIREAADLSIFVRERNTERVLRCICLRVEWIECLARYFPVRFCAEEYGCEAA